MFDQETEQVDTKIADQLVPVDFEATARGLYSGIRAEDYDCPEDACREALNIYLVNVRHLKDSVLKAKTNIIYKSQELSQYFRSLSACPIRSIPTPWRYQRRVRCISCHFGHPRSKFSERKCLINGLHFWPIKERLDVDADTGMYGRPMRARRVLEYIEKTEMLKRIAEIEKEAKRSLDDVGYFKKARPTGT